MVERIKLEDGETDVAVWLSCSNKAHDIAFVENAEPGRFHHAAFQYYDEKVKAECYPGTLGIAFHLYGRILKLGKRLAVVSDANTVEAMGRRVARELKALGTVEEIVMPGNMECDEPTIALDSYYGSKRGWMIDLPTRGERIVIDARIRGGRVIFTSTIPNNTDICNYGGSGWVLEFDVFTGNRLDSATSTSALRASEFETYGARSLGEVIDGAHIFLGLSAGGVLKPEMVAQMADKPLVMALANPVPEIMPDDARKARPDAMICTGRSDFPNQVNNVLCFPFIFRGALDVGASEINEAMKVAWQVIVSGLSSMPNGIAWNGGSLFIASLDPYKSCTVGRRSGVPSRGSANSHSNKAPLAKRWRMAC